MSELTINGSQREFSDGQMPSTLAELLDVLDINHATVVAELEGQIVERKNFGRTQLAGGESIELIRFVGGGGIE